MPVPGHVSAAHAVLRALLHVGCVPALRLVDRVGRRPVIVWSFALMVVPLAVLGGGDALPIAVVIVCFCGYALLSGGPTVLEWTYPNELFPTSIRATAGGRHRSAVSAPPPARICC
ncbi:MFS transporter [Streptomyces spinoverrucosus]|uniref:MFS transporter n=1 Tax=Streptomyces spinoverrucosus TaxID=284043 RepID=UPI001142A410